MSTAITAPAIEEITLTDKAVLKDFPRMKFIRKINPSVNAALTRTIRNEIPYTEASDAICIIGMFSCWLWPSNAPGSDMNDRWERIYSIVTQRKGATSTFNHFVLWITNVKERPKSPKNSAQKKTIKRKVTKGRLGTTFTHWTCNAQKTAPVRKAKKKDLRYESVLRETNKGMSDIHTNNEKL